MTSHHVLKRAAPCGKGGYSMPQSDLAKCLAVMRWRIRNCIGLRETLLKTARGKNVNTIYRLRGEETRDARERPEEKRVQKIKLTGLLLW